MDKLLQKTAVIFFAVATLAIIFNTFFVWEPSDAGVSNPPASSFTTDSSGNLISSNASAHLGSSASPITEIHSTNIKTDTLQIEGGSPSLNDVLTSDATGIATWQDADTGGWTTGVDRVRLTNLSDKVGIGTLSPNATLEVIGPSAGTVGGFSSGLLHVRGNGTTEFSNAVITGHSSFAGNTQLWYLGSAASSNNDILFINRQNANLSLYTNNTERLRIRANGDILLNSYPNTRDDGTPINILGTDASGNLISGPNEVIHIGGNFVDTTDQTISTTSLGQAITFNTNSLIDDISHSTTTNSDTFTINTDGVYVIIVAPQLSQGAGSATVEFWIEKNGTPIVNSNVQETVAANSEALPLLRWKERFVATDTFKIIWASDSTASMLNNITSTYGGPNIPSIMLGVTQTGS